MKSIYVLLTSSGYRVQPDLGSPKLVLKDDASVDEYVKLATPQAQTNFASEFWFYNEKTHEVIQMLFSDINDDLKEAIEKNETLGVNGLPDFKMVYSDTAPKEYDVNSVVVEAEKPLSEQLVADVIKAFDYYKGNDIDLEELSGALKDVEEECPVGIVDVIFNKRDDGTVDIVIKVEKYAEKFLVTDLDDKDPLKIKIDEVIKEKDLRFYKPDILVDLDKLVSEAEDGSENYYRGGTVSENANGDMVLSISKYENVRSVQITGEDNENVKEFFKEPITKKELGEAMTKMHEHFASLGKAVAIKVEKVEEYGSGLMLVLEYETRQIPKTIEMAGDLPIDAAKVRELFGEPKSPNGYTYPELEKGVVKLKEFLEEEYVLSVENFVDAYGNVSYYGGLVDIEGGVVKINLSAARLDEHKIVMLENNKIDPEVIMRQFETKKGEFFNKKKFKEALERIYMTQQFDSVVDVEGIEVVDGKISPVILVKPKNACESLMAMLGYERSNLIGGVGTSFRRINKEEHIALSMSYYPWTQTGTISFFDPWFFDKARSLLVSLSGGTYDYESLRMSFISLSVLVGFPLGGTFSPWRLTTGSGITYMDYESGKPKEMTSIPVEIKPSVTVSYTTRRRAAALTVTGSGGALNYPEVKGYYVEDIPIYKDLISIELTASGGQKFVKEIPFYSRYNVMNTPTVYGQSLQTYVSGTSFVNAGAKVVFHTGDVVQIKAGLTAGGVGSGPGDIAKIGVGAEIGIPAVGITLSGGYLINMVSGKRGPGVFIRFGPEQRY